jgi:hypothetical protein
MQLVNDVESDAQLALGRRQVIDRIDMRMSRPVTQELAQTRVRIGITERFELDTAIGAVAHPAAQREPFRMLPQPVTETHALHATAHAVPPSFHRTSSMLRHFAG